MFTLGTLNKITFPVKGNASNFKSDSQVSLQITGSQHGKNVDILFRTTSSFSASKTVLLTFDQPEETWALRNHSIGSAEALNLTVNIVYT